MKNKKKTALQILIESLEVSMMLMHLPDDEMLRFSIKEAESLLQKEKEDINNAYDIGCGSGIRGFKINYFNETFES
jgi:methylase of polypeptide subunit release factors